ncbi:MAG TPA: DUF4277 domain-containing protein, partial [Dehalococcoidia bacterium]|nr:DUF4277 domain-containing protein [Dehalococcoidia bacterium]
MTMRQLLVKRLGALPVIREYLERLQLQERVDALALVREVAHLTNGEVVEALGANRLTAPRPLYDSVEWAQTWAVAETFGIRPADLNDDRLGRCLDDLAAVHDRLRGDLTVQAIAAFGLETRALRWDLTSVLVTGEYPGKEQVRYLQVTTDEGAVPVWDQPYDGKTTDVATVSATMEAWREHARCTDFVLIGDSKLLSAANRQALLAAEVGYLAPLARPPELAAAFGAIPPDAWTRLEYVSERARSQPAAERTTDLGWDSTVAVSWPDDQGRPRRRWVRRLFLI